jgi:two-component system, NarL family, sensor kinase
MLAAAVAATAILGAVWAGMTWPDLVASYLVTNLAIAVGFATCGAVVAAHRPGNPVGWLMLAAGLAQGTTAAVTPLLVAGGARGWSTPVMAALAMAYAYAWPWSIGLVLPLALLLFPDGNLPGRMWRWAVGWLMVVGCAFAVMMGSEPDNVVLGDGTVVAHPLSLAAHDRLAPVWAGVGLAVLGSYAIAFAALVVRYRRGDETRRRQLLWLLLGTAAAVVVPLPTTQFGVGPILLILAICLIPASIAIAIVRHNLLDIRLVASRAVLWGALSVGVIAVYVALVAVLGQLLSQRFSAVAAALAVAFAFNPVRLAAQRLVDRLFYGHAHDPVRAIARIEGHLGRSHDLTGLLTAIRDALRVPFVQLRTDDLLLTSGEEPGAVHPVPLVSAHDQVGELTVGLRTGEHRLRDRDRRLLELLAGPLAVAVHATELTARLQRSQERLIEAREDERRRLRRDLHDGLGPQLTGVTFKADAAHNLLTTDPQRSEGLLDEVRADVRAAITDIRRLIHALRPSALDELGLVGALEQRVHDLGAGADHGGPAIRLEAPACLPALPPGVELAAYRVAVEALTNAARHAQARQVVVGVRIDEDLHVEIVDDGHGRDGSWQPGVGLSTMHERVAELGGSLTAGPGTDGGRVVATFPVEQP